MKKIFFVLLIIALAAKVQTSSAQEKLKEGKITYEITYPESEDMSDQMLAMMPKDVTTYFKNGKSRSETKSSFFNSITFFDPETKESTTCTEMMGRKSAVKTTSEEAEAEKEKTLGEYEVKATDETKKIAGYTAKKFIVTFKSEHEPIEVWVTDEIAAQSSGRNTFKGIVGFPLDMTMEQKTGQGNLKMRMTATKIEKAPVSDDMFKMPEGFKLMTKEEMMQQFKDRKPAGEGAKPGTETNKKDTVK